MLTLAPEIGECVSARVTVPRIVPWAARLDPPSATVAAEMNAVWNQTFFANLLSMRFLVAGTEGES
jgi:hypothetical protein